MLLMSLVMRMLLLMVLQHETIAVVANSKSRGKKACLPYSMRRPTIVMLTRNYASFIWNHARNRDMSAHASGTHTLDKIFQGRNVSPSSPSFSVFCFGVRPLRLRYSGSVCSSHVTYYHVLMLFGCPCPRACVSVCFSVAPCCGPQRERLETSVRRALCNQVRNMNFLCGWWSCLRRCMPRCHASCFALECRMGDGYAFPSAW